MNVGRTRGILIVDESRWADSRCPIIPGTGSLKEVSERGQFGRDGLPLEKGERVMDDDDIRPHGEPLSLFVSSHTQRVLLLSGYGGRCIPFEGACCGGPEVMREGIETVRPRNINYIHDTK